MSGAAIASVIPATWKSRQRNFQLPWLRPQTQPPNASENRLAQKRAVKRSWAPSEQLIWGEASFRFSRGNQVKTTFVRIATVLTALAAMTLMTGHAFAAADAAVKPDLKGLVKWGVWHEGCRVYAGDNSLGDVEEVRTCLVGVYAQNEAGQRQLREASKTTLSAAIRAAASEIPSERQIDRFIEFACKHKGLLQSFRQLVEANDYDSIRAEYFANFQGVAEVRNLLAAISDRDLAYAVRQVELTQNTSEASGD